MSFLDFSATEGILSYLCRRLMPRFIFISSLLISLIAIPALAFTSDVVDLDGDHIPDAWEAQHGLNPSDSGDADLDNDGDRFTNRDEFYADSDPIAYTSVQALSDRSLLNLFQGKAFLYFWEQSRTPYYFTADKSDYNNPSYFSNNFNSIASTGFALAAYVMADDRGWIDHEQAYERIRTLLARAVESQNSTYDLVGVPPSQQGNRHGYLYHFVDNNGFRHPGSEISTIDHALFVAGALVAAEYYPGTEVEQLANQLFVDTDWNWLYNGTVLYQGWLEDPTGTFEGGRTLDSWNRYSELLILLFLAMGHPDSANAIPSSAWDALTYGTGRMFPNEYVHLFPGDNPQNFAFVPNMPNTIEEAGYTNSATEFHYLHAGSLHNHQYSHLYVDFRARRDRWNTDFFSNSIGAAMANRQFCINLNTHAFGGDPNNSDPYLRQPYETYQPNVWGLMAGIPSYTGYAVLQPIVMSWDNFSPDNIALNSDSGSVVLSAPLGSTPFTPRQTLDFIRHLLTKFQASEPGFDGLSGRYGFRNAFNLGRPYNSNQIGHFPPEIIGLDLGPVAGAGENFQSGLIWKFSLRSPYLQAGMQAAGYNTGAVEPFIMNFDDSPPAPHEDPNGGGQDPNSFGGFSYGFGTGSIAYTWIDDPLPAVPFGPQQWAQRISAQNNNDSGAFILLNNHSVSRWDRLSFWIRGEVGGEAYSIGLKDRAIDRLGNSLQVTEVKLPIASYHPAGTITSEWTEVRIPLRDFQDGGVRFTELDNISFTNVSSGVATIYIDDIAFLGDEFLPAPPEGLSVTTDGQSVALVWQASTEHDVVGYRIYRSSNGGANYNLLNALLAVGTTFIDTSASHQQYSYRVAAVDNAEPQNEGPYAETSVFVNKPPVLAPIGNRSVSEGQTLSFSVSASDPDGDTLTYSASPLPSGATFNSTSKTFSWTPTFAQSGDYSVTFTVSDGNLTDQETIIITVNEVPITIASLTDSPDPFSPNRDKVKDTTKISGGFNHTASWALDIKNASNQLIRSFTGNGASINQTWDGKNNSGAVVADGIYTYALAGTDIGGSSVSNSGTATVDTAIPVLSNVNDSPDPFRPSAGQSTTISFTLSEQSYVTLRIYNSTNKLVRTLLSDSLKSAGNNSVQWNGRNSFNAIVPPGIYTYKIWVTDNAGNKANLYPQASTVQVQA